MKWKKDDLKIFLWPIGVIAACVLLYFFTPKLIDILGFLTGLLLPFIIGYVLSKLVNPIANLLQKKLKIPRGVSAIIVIVLVIGGVAALVYLAASKLKNQVDILYFKNPDFKTYLETHYSYAIEKLMEIYDGLPKAVKDAMTGMFSNSGSATDVVMNYATRFLKAMPNAFVAIIVSILSLYFMVSDSTSITALIDKVFKTHTSKSALVWSQIRRYVGGYVKAQLIIMSITATIMTVWFLGLHIRYAVLIAVGIAFLDALPVFGSGLILWPWAAMSFLNGDMRLGVCLILVFASIALTRHLIEPKLVSTNVGMNPLLTLMSMYIGYRMLSVGGLIAGPLIMLLMVSLYKGGVFDMPLSITKQVLKKTKRTLVSMRDYILSDDEENQ